MVQWMLGFTLAFVVAIAWRVFWWLQSTQETPNPPVRPIGFHTRPAGMDPETQ